jgi:hypothetical protein
MFLIKCSTTAAVMILISFSGNGWNLLHVIFLFSQVDHLKYWAAGHG